MVQLVGSPTKSRKQARVHELLETMDRDTMVSTLMKASVAGFEITEPQWRNPEPYIKRNGFRLPAEKLNFQRFRFKRNPVDEDSEWMYPDHMAGAAEWCDISAKLCRKNEKAFWDPEQTELELKEPKLYLQIHTTIKDPDHLAQLKMEHERAEGITAHNRGIMANILGQIHVWRKPHLVLEQPRLFAAGNRLQEYQPQDAKPKNAPGSPRSPKGPSPKKSSFGGGDRIPSLVKFKDNGIFYDVHFLCAVAMAAVRKSVFSNLFVSTEHGDIGMYTFQFFSTLVDELNTPEWRLVTVDNVIPMDANYSPVLGQLQDPNECWLFYLEKAYAKFLESYSQLHHGDVADSVTHLTGGFTLLEEWSPMEVSDEWKAHIWWIIRTNCRHGLLTAAVQIDGKAGPHTGEDTKHTLRTKADYMEWNESAVVVLDTTECQMKTADKAWKKIIKMRNMYGKVEWFGDWCNDSKSWSKDYRMKAGYPLDAQDDYIHWMEINDFTQKYNTLLTCQGYASAPTMFYRYVQKTNEGQCPFYAHQYLITIIDPADPKFQKSLKTDGDDKPKPRSNLVFIENMHKFEESDDEGVPDDSDDEDDWSKHDRMKKVEKKDNEMELAEGGRQDEKSEYSESALSKWTQDTDASAGTIEARRAEKNKFNFQALKNQLRAGGAEVVEEEAEPEATGPQFKARIELSQPSHFTHTGYCDSKVQDPHPVTVEVFQMRGPLLQPCSFVENQSLGDTDQKEGDLVHYRFPTNNRVTVKDEKAGDNYTVLKSCSLQPGFYVVAIHQELYFEDLHYCLRLDTEDDPAFPTHFITKIEELGSCGFPIKKPDETKKKAATPELEEARGSTP